jgi:histone deacetylase complex regulatory component SIN3
MIIQNRFITAPGVYKAFLETLHEFHKQNQSISEVHAHVAHLFKVQHSCSVSRCAASLCPAASG